MTPHDARMIKKILAEEVKDPGLLTSSVPTDSNDNKPAKSETTGSSCSLSSTLESAMRGDEKAVEKIKEAFEKSVNVSKPSKRGGDEFGLSVEESRDTEGTKY